MPWPADYGGVIDVYYRLEALHRAGVHITLHCFTYGRMQAPRLEALCDQVYYYRRNMSPGRHLSKIPFIAASRDNDELLQRLRQDDVPVLIEGLHGCELLRRWRELESVGRRHRTVLVRAHNVEQDYYRLLARSERRPLRKAYLALEAWKLRGYEQVLTQADAVLAITDADACRFRQMGCSNVITIPPFLPPLNRDGAYNHSHIHTFTHLSNNKYVLFHADLSVPDNEWAVRWLQRNVMCHVGYAFVVAGRSPRASLCRYLSRFGKTRVVESPSQDAMDALISSAQCTVMITRQPTGFKLKLINSLVHGQHCVVNSAMVAGTGLEGCCHVADTAVAMRRTLEELMQTPFDEAQRQVRQDELRHLFDAEAQVRQIVALLS